MERGDMSMEHNHNILDNFNQPRKGYSLEEVVEILAKQAGLHLTRVYGLTTDGYNNSVVTQGYYIEDCKGE